MKRVRSESERTGWSMIMILGGVYGCGVGGHWVDVLWCDSMRTVRRVFCIGYKLIGSIEEVSFTSLLWSVVQNNYIFQEHGYRTDGNGYEGIDVMNLKCAGSGVGFGL